MGTQTTNSDYTPPIEYTEAFAAFQERHLRALHFFFFLEQFRGDQAALNTPARKKYLEHYEAIAATMLPQFRSELEKQRERLWRDGDPPHEVLESHLPFILEMIYCRAIDDYLRFVSDLLLEVYRKHPHQLKGDRTVKYGDVLQFTDMSKLLEFITDKYVNELSYFSMRKLSSTLSSDLHFDLFLDEDHLDNAVFFNEVRNIFVHNGGVMTAKLIETKMGASAKVGGILVMTGDLFMEAMNFFWNMAIHADRKAMAKWRLPLSETRGQAFLASPKQKFALRIGAQTTVEPK